MPTGEAREKMHLDDVSCPVKKCTLDDVTCPTPPPVIKEVIVIEK